MFGANSRNRYKGEFGKETAPATIRLANMQSARLWERALGFAADDKGNQASISRRQASHRTTLQFSSANFEDARLERLEESSVSHMFTSRHLSIGDVTLKRYKNDLQADKIWKEFDLLQDTHNERVVRMFGAFFDGSPYLVLEPLLGSLDGLQDKLDQRLTLRIAHDVLEGLQFLHGRNVVHCDLKLCNIFITYRHSFVISDLTSAVRVKGGKPFISFERIGTLINLNPAALEQKCYSKHTDLWGLACAIFKLSTREDLIKYEAMTITEDSCLDVAQNGYLVIDSDEARHRVPLKDRIKRSNHHQLLQNLMFDETSTATNLLQNQELWEIKRIDQDVASEGLTQDLMGLMQQCKDHRGSLTFPKELILSPTTKHPSFMAFLHFYYESRINGMAVLPKVISIASGNKAKQLLQNMDCIFEQSDPESMGLFGDIISDVLGTRHFSIPPRKCQETQTTEESAP